MIITLMMNRVLSLLADTGTNFAGNVNQELTRACCW
jgi:hypothetical protein